MIIFTKKCSECKREFPRAEFRKRAGGHHAKCRQCRKIVYNERAVLKRQVTTIRADVVMEEVSSRLQSKLKQLQQEYNKSTRENRNRIKKLMANPNPTKATVANLKKRLEEQELWDRAYRKLQNTYMTGHFTPLLNDYVIAEKEAKCTKQ